MSVVVPLDSLSLPDPVVVVPDAEVAEVAEVAVVGASLLELVCVAPVVPVALPPVVPDGVSDVEEEAPELAPSVSVSDPSLSQPDNISAIATAPVRQPISMLARVPLLRTRWPLCAHGSTFRDMDDRIVELEVRAAYQDKTISDLDEVIRAFAERVILLERELQLLKETMKTGVPDVGPQDERPPHY